MNRVKRLCFGSFCNGEMNMIETVLRSPQEETYAECGRCHNSFPHCHCTCPYCGERWLWVCTIWGHNRRRLNHEHLRHKTNSLCSMQRIHWRSTIRCRNNSTKMWSMCRTDSSPKRQDELLNVTLNVKLEVSQIESFLKSLIFNYI